MYEIYFANSKSEKIIQGYLNTRKDIKNKLIRLKQNPRKEIGAHSLHGKLLRKWACWLGSNIRMIYSIDDLRKIIYIEAVGSHKIY